MSQIGTLNHGGLNNAIVKIKKHEKAYKKPINKKNIFSLILPRLCFSIL
jgi:hypothetical protein